MSQEFEKIVLEKLDRIETTLDEHKDILKQHTEQFKQVRKDIYQINNKIIKNAEKMKDMEEVIIYNTQTIKEYNEKNAKEIDISLKAYKQLNDKVEIDRGAISNLMYEDFKKNFRITSLEEAIKGKGLTA